MLLFALENYRAYRDYFKRDDFYTLGWTPLLSWSAYAKAWLTWRFQPDNFRPVAHSYYHLMNSAAHFSYKPWVAGVQLLVIASAVLLWFVLAEMGLRPAARAVGCALLLLHPSLFDAYWKPMYVFDTSCAFFLLVSLLAWMRNRWLVSLIAFYTAYRCKEVAVMFPVVLLGYEFLLGQRRVKRLLPFFAVSICFGIQAMLFNRSAPQTAYTMLFNAHSLSITLPFYMHTALGFAWSGVLVSALLLAARTRSAYFGLLAFWVLLIPLLFLPGRLFDVYTYVPMTGLAIAVASVLSQPRIPDRAIVACVLIWAVFPFLKMRTWSRDELGASAGMHSYVQQLQRIVEKRPAAARTYIYGALPAEMDRFSVQAIITNLTRTNAVVVSRDEAGVLVPDDSGSALLLDWDEPVRRLNSAAVSRQ